MESCCFLVQAALKARVGVPDVGGSHYPSCDSEDASEDAGVQTLVKLFLTYSGWPAIGL